MVTIWTVADYVNDPVLLQMESGKQKQEDGDVSWKVGWVPLKLKTGLAIIIQKFFEHE